MNKLFEILKRPGVLAGLLSIIAALIGGGAVEWYTPDADNTVQVDDQAQKIKDLQDRMLWQEMIHGASRQDHP